MTRTTKVIAWLLILSALVRPQIAEATIHDISISNFFFAPTNTVVNVGDTVRWTWMMGTHSTTSDAGSPKSWDSGNKSSGSFEIVITPLDGPGPFPYHCTPHFLTMKDTIWVSAVNDGDGDGIPDIADNCPFTFNTAQTDSDGDAFGAACDCNDADFMIHPGAPEIPDDGVDQDCNGADAVTCFVDADMDGYGSNSGATTIALDGVCDAGAGEATNDLDCDDADPSVNPGAPEIPNDGIDQDCDGSDLVTSCCQIRVGDANSSGADEPTIGDISVMIDAKFITGTCAGILNCLDEADINQSGAGVATCADITIGDISTLIDYLFITGPSLGLANCL